MYIYFPRPMGKDSALNFISIQDSDGRTVDGVFHRVRYDLWSPDRQRLTMLVDPGRIKTGLSAKRQLGQALTAGTRYSLTIADGFPDAQGCPLGFEYVHRFKIEAADLDVPNPERWSLDVPDAGSAEPLIVDLGSPHDHLSLAFRMRVQQADDSQVRGHIELRENESVWVFTPQMPWAAAAYRIAIDNRLEDLAGNRPGVLFDHPVGIEADDRSIILEFQPGT